MKMASMWWTQDNAPETTTRTNNELEDLFVFGYACKIFRDDEKASYIDRGKHLIPWMGDERLLIDRYDGRGHLYDLSAYDADNVHSENIELSETEKAVEAACDEERYLELRTDVAEAELYQEEEWKRYYQSLHDGYKAVGFSYEQPTADEGQTSQQHNNMTEMEEDKPFVVPPELQVPKGVDLPATKKENAIIEKTAKFIAEHGMQMEIIIKTKQSGNPQFDFMHFEDKLNFYYRHMVKMIKSGKYKPVAPETSRQDSHEDEDNQHHEHGYLHPLLNANITTTQPSKPIKMPPVSIHNTSYGQLIKSIKKSSAKAPENGSSTSQSASRDTPPLAPPPLPPFVAQPIYSSAHPGLPPPPGTEPVVLPHSEFPSYPQGGDMKTDIKEEDEGGGRSTPIVPPPPDSQPIIDRMAMYVAKNGVEFEIVVKSKNDQRFQFLHPWHVHFPYYDFKKQLFLKEVEQERQEKEEAAAAAANKAVSFSIKTRTKEPENNVTQLRKPLFDYGSSDDENEGESDTQKEKTADFTSSSPAASESGQGSEVNLEVKPEVRTDIPVDALEKKLAEERLKDRLANAAREKLAQASKEKQVQAERKRKAAMFINLLRNKPTSADDSSRDGATESYSSLSPRGTPNNSRPSTPGVRSSKERSIPRDDRDSYAEYDRYDSYRRGWSIRSRSRSPHHQYRSRSRSPRARHRSRSKSPVFQWRRRRSPTPPSAFSSVRRSRSRSGSRRSPARVNTGRRRSRSRSPRKIVPVPSRSRPRSRSPKTSRSPAKKRSKSRDKKRKSKSPSRSKKRSRSKSPSSKHKKSKKSDTRSPKKKKKDKDKDKEKSREKRKDKNKEKTKDRERDKSRDKGRSEKAPSNTESASKTDVKPVEESKDSDSEQEGDTKSEVRNTSSESDEETARGSESAQKIRRSSHDSETGSKGQRSSVDSQSESKIEVIEIDDNDDNVDGDIPPPPGPPPSLPPLPPLPPDEEKTQSPRLLPETDTRETSSGRGSPALDADGKPPREVSKHLLSRVRALLKASRDEVLKEEGGLDDP